MKIVKETNTILLPAQSTSQNDRIVALERYLTRQLGIVVKFEIVKDKKNKKYAVVGWDFTEKELKVLKMALRRNKITNAEREKKSVAQVKAEKELSKEK